MKAKTSALSVQGIGDRALALVMKCNRLQEREHEKK